MITSNTRNESTDEEEKEKVLPRVQSMQKIFFLDESEANLITLFYFTC